MTELPSTWEMTTLGEIAISIRNGISEKPSGDRGQPILRISAVRPFSLDLTDVRYLSNAPALYRDHALEQGDLLFTRYNGTPALVGVCAVVPDLASQLVYPDKLIRVRLNRGRALPAFVQYAVNVGVSRAHVESRARTTAGQTGISGSDLRTMPLPLPSLDEQRRIVAALEEHLSDLDAAVVGLHRARANVELFREAVRDAAATGLLGDGQVHLKTPGGRTGGETPDGWQWITVGESAAPEPNAITDGPFGSKLKTEHYVESGPRVIRLQNIGRGVFLDAKAHIAPEHFATLQKHRVYEGDVVIAALGETLPRACIIPASVGPAIVKADCIRFKPDSSRLSSAFANIALNADSTRRRVAAVIHGVGRPRLNLRELREIVFLLPPLDVQRRLVEHVESRLIVADQTLSEIDVQLARATRLKHAILKRAFEGNLVPRNCDEPSSAFFTSLHNSPSPAVERPQRAHARSTTRRGRD